MPRAILIHWKPAESGALAGAIRGGGWEVAVVAPDGAAGLRGFRAHPPDAFVIDLGRLPSQGRAVALELRRQKGTRAVPLVIVGGAPEKAAATRQLLPDAIYTDPDGVAEALGAALARPLAAPVVPSTMAGYAGTPLVKKLGIRAGTAVALLGAPEDFTSQLEGLPAEVRLVRRAGGAAGTILLFVRTRAELERRFPAATRSLEERGGLWIVWPKKGSALAGDLTETGVRAFGLAAGFVDYKICAVDGTWSGLLFARRVSRRRNAAPR